MDLVSYLKVSLITSCYVEPANARASAREKLTRLTRQQFQELSTDVYDELLRRKNNTENEGVLHYSTGTDTASRIPWIACP